MTILSDLTAIQRLGDELRAAYEKPEPECRFCADGGTCWAHPWTNPKETKRDP